jgi:RNA polymerase sigma factor (sigma-70 family)
MATAPLDTVLHHVRRLAGHDQSDQRLLRDFTARHDETAFAALVARHGPLVLRVCRRVLGHEQDAEDAFQVTFLVLARGAATIRKRDSLADWLHGVAFRTAMKIKRSEARRRAREMRVARGEASTGPGPTWSDVQTALDEEIRRLPEPFRSSFILCVLDGKSGTEAARELGCKEGTVSSRVTRARQVLQRALTRRGIELASLLGTFAVGEGAARAVSPSLIKETVRFGLLVANGEPAAGAIPPHLTALAKGAVGVTSVTKTKLLAAVLLAALTLAGALAARYEEEPRQQTRSGVVTAAPRKETIKPPEAPTDEKDAVTYAGRVIGPDGKPVAGAKVHYHFITREKEPIPVRAVTDADGRFSFTLTRKDVPLSADAIQSDPLRTGQVIVKTDGFTFAWQGRRKEAGDLLLQLARDDVPIEGRFVDLEGKPLAGLRITAMSVAAPEKGDLSAFLKALESGDTFHVALFKHLPNNLDNPILGRRGIDLLPKTTTDANGRFRLGGFAPDRVVELRVEGGTVETASLFVLTRPRPGGSARLLTPPRMRDPFFGPDGPVLVFWNSFDHALAPGLTVVGTVRDAKTGKPIPGAIVESYKLAGQILSQNTIYHTVADAEGHYVFTGLPRGKDNRIRINPPKDRPYFPVVKNVPVPETFGKATGDAELQPAVWVDVTATDKGTGKPVPGYVSYFVLPEKWDAEARFQQPFGDAYNHMMANRNDGVFRFAALPRKAILAFRTDWAKYPIAREASTIRLPSGLSPSNFQAFAEIDPKPDKGPVKVAFVLDAGRVVKGKILGPDGQPLTGALAAGLRHDWFVDAESPLRTAEFTALGLGPARPRLLCFAHPEKKLAGSLIVRGDEKELVIVKLQPWATVTGRLLDAAGKPIKNTSLWFTEVPPCKPNRPRALDVGLHVVNRSAYQPSSDPKTDNEGRFKIECLIPGLKYNLVQMDSSGAFDFDQVKWTGLVFKGLVLQAGETKDLGDVTLQPFPEK